MSGETFTIEDAENDGKLKGELAPELAKVAAQSGGELYDFFLEVCDHEGREPKEVLASLALKAVRNEDFAQRLAEVEVNMSEVMSGRLRAEDAEFVMEFSDRLGLDEDDGTHWLKETVQEQVKKRTDSPVPRLGTEREGGGGGQMSREVKELKKELAALRKEVADGEVKGGEQEVEDLFEDADDDSTTVEVVDETTEEEDVEESDVGTDKEGYQNAPEEMYDEDGNGGIPSSTEVKPDDG